MTIVGLRREEGQGHPYRYPYSFGRRLEGDGNCRSPHFGALLRQFRLDAGLTQQQLAERAKLSVEAISTLERGARTPSLRDTVNSSARALGLSAERQALLGSASALPHATRQRERSEALNASLLRLVRPDAQATPRHNLPAQLTSLVGRQSEIAEIAALLREHRLLTVVGAGGVGKTRIAVQTGSDLSRGQSGRCVAR